MRDIVTPNQIHSALHALLGLPKHCVSFELSVRFNQPVTVACEHHVALDAPGLEQLESVFSQYDLVHRPAPVCDQAADDGAKLHVVDFDAWMRVRTERSHREFMRRTSALAG